LTDGISVEELAVDLFDMCGNDSTRHDREPVEGCDVSSSTASTPHRLANLFKLILRGRDVAEPRALKPVLPVPLADDHNDLRSSHHREANNKVSGQSVAPPRRAIHTITVALI
jgi:hypothetical protein